MSDKTKLIEQLEKSRKELIDLSSRNRLINTPIGSSRSSRIDIIDEHSDFVFDYIVTQRRPMYFAHCEIPSSTEEKPSENSDSRATDLGQPSFDDPGRHTDNLLQTSMSSDALQKRLLKTYYDAKTYEEEQGISILYLACGFLKWYESENSEIPRHAPLILIPVNLVRKDANSRFSLTFRDEEIRTNISLQSKLRAEFGIGLPDIDENDEFSILRYFQDVKAIISSSTKWIVEENRIVLWFYSFSKMMMFNDMKPESWANGTPIHSHELIQKLLGGGFERQEPIIPPGANVDTILDSKKIHHVVDADSSQATAIFEITAGRNLVIQGPPGTGKSQTITNVIASCVADGKSVLFVSEKMAALDVVKSRLEAIGLGDLCLELHSQKANKKVVLDELKKTLELGVPTKCDSTSTSKPIADLRKKLNYHAEIINDPIGLSNCSLIDAIGHYQNNQQDHMNLLDLQLIDPISWTPEDFEKMVQFISELCATIDDIGLPVNHIFYEVESDGVTPSTFRQTYSSLTQLNKLLTTLPMHLEKSEYNALNLTIFELEAIGESLSWHLGSPDHRLPQIDPKTWQELRSEAWKTVNSGIKLNTDTISLNSVFLPETFDKDLSEVSAAINKWASSPFKIFVPKYNQAVRVIKSCLKDPSSFDQTKCIKLLQLFTTTQQNKLLLAQESISNSLGKCFGVLWKASNSNFELLKTVCEWLDNMPIHCEKYPIKINGEQCIAKSRTMLEKIQEFVVGVTKEVNEVSGLLKLRPNCPLNLLKFKTVAIDVLSSKVGLWVSNADRIHEITKYNHLAQKCRVVRAPSFLDKISRGEIATENAVKVFKAAYYESLIESRFGESKDLLHFRGESHESLIKHFSEMDTKAIESARIEVASVHHERLPNSHGDHGQLGTLRREFAKKKRHMPIRKLLKETANVVQSIKPVFMMSPVSVAQFLEPGAMEFDILVVDEASQVRPVDAIGAIARCKQIVIVGDDRQLPPTSFFGATAADDQIEEDEEFSTKDLESILSLCVAQNVPQRMLRWHYRSQHESLIAVSNLEFYDSRLIIPPSPEKFTKEFGLKLEYVPEGVFDRGASATNRIEAKRVVEAVMKHAAEKPHQSLGVGAFSVKQRDSILEELEQRRRENPETEPFFSSESREPFFVKNLENIQGDERDVIFISVGYGKDSRGTISMNFGPLNTEGGERRLNVLISRAKQRCHVFTSILSADIDLSRTQARGVAGFKSFLHYAEHGHLDIPKVTGRGFDSPFEEQVASFLTAHGYHIDTQIGVAGFFIDLGIKDPEQPGRYMLGIECDGATYHSSASARDRDRLRQSLLEQRGWIIHRIWSTDWFRESKKEKERLISAIEIAKSNRNKKAMTTAEIDRSKISKALNFNEQESSQLITRIAKSNEAAKSVELVFQKYAETNIPVPSNEQIHEISPKTLEIIVKKIVDAEGPIHSSLVSRRITLLWNLKRAGSRISSLVNNALKNLELSGDLSQEDGFFSSHQPTNVTPRDRSDSASEIKKPELLPPQEIRTGLILFIDKNPGVSRSNTIIEISRLFGFKSTSVQLKEMIERQLDFLAKSHSIIVSGDHLQVIQKDEQKAKKVV